jgi:hypothetical protein
MLAARRVLVARPHLLRLIIVIGPEAATDGIIRPLAIGLG